MSESNDTYRYDAFISYSHHDKEWVQGWLLPRLEAGGLRICIDFRDFEPGLPSLVNMENAIERSRKTLIVLTPDWVESEWTTFESLLIQTDDPAGRRARMIPLMLKPCDPPKRIAMLTYLDFTQPSEVEFQLQRLIGAIQARPTPEVSRPVRDRRIDAAVPSHAEVGQRTDLLVQVRFSDSPLLGIEDWPTKQKPTSIEQASERVALEFPVDHRTGKLGSARLQIRVVAPDFAMEGAAQQVVEVPPDQYSKCISFLLTATKAGSCRINVEVYSIDHIYLGVIPVEIETTISGLATSPTTKVTTLVIVVMVGQEPILAHRQTEERTFLKRELDRHKRNVRLLLEKKAVDAAGEERLHLLNQIEAEEQEIRSIEQRLAELAEVPVSPSTPPPRSPSPVRPSQPEPPPKAPAGIPALLYINLALLFVTLLAVLSFINRYFSSTVFTIVIAALGILGNLVAATKFQEPLRRKRAFWVCLIVTLSLILANVVVNVLLSSSGPKEGDEPTLCRLGHEIMISAGFFRMGSDDEQPDAKPQHEVYVEAFCIDKYEATNEEYKEFVDATGHRVPYVNTYWAEPYNWDKARRIYPAGKADHPIVLASWDDAKAYCQWAGKRLPTEAEWEKAARGTEGRRYPWGNEWDLTKANTLEGGRGETAPVGMYREGASAYGAMDMAGNVWEWAEDRYKPYPASTYWSKMFEEDRRVLRGGSWQESGKSEKSIEARGPVSVSYGSVTTAFRLGAIPSDQLNEVGFRCARSIAPIITVTPTPTPTSSPTPTPTPTSTSSPTPTPTSTPICPIRINEAIPYENGGASLETGRGEDPTRPDAIKITFANPLPESFSAWVVSLYTCDVTTSESLSFWVRGEKGGEQFEVGIRDSTTLPGHDPKVPQIAPAGWQRVSIPLQKFQDLKKQDLSSLENFSLGFKYDLGSGTIYIDEFTFGPP